MRSLAKPKFRLKAAVGAAAALAGIGWLGFQIPPEGFAPTPESARDLGTIGYPSDLPAPVLRFLQSAFGEHLPRVETLVIRGRGRAHLGLWLPLRYRTSYRAGQDFRREMQFTWFGRTLFTVNDTFVGGRGAMRIGSKVSAGEGIDQGANLALWAEVLNMPSVMVTEPRLRWEAVDQHSAHLHVPFGSQQDRLTFHFDPQTGRPASITALRFRDQDQRMVPWRVDLWDWQKFPLGEYALQVAVTWEDMGRPWSYWTIDAIEMNVPVDAYLPEAGSA